LRSDEKESIKEIPNLAASNLKGSPVPEPGTLVLLSVAVCGAAVYQRVRSRRKKF